VEQVTMTKDQLFRTGVSPENLSKIALVGCRLVWNEIWRVRYTEAE
jgi:hypothetical protein